MATTRRGRRTSRTPTTRTMSTPKGSTASDHTRRRDAPRPDPDEGLRAFALPPGGPGPCEFLYGVRSAAPVYMSRTPSSHSLETGARDASTSSSTPAPHPFVPLASSPGGYIYWATCRKCCITSPHTTPACITRLPPIYLSDHDRACLLTRDVSLWGTALDNLMRAARESLHG